MIFKCRNCGGNVIYSPEKRTMYCPFCDSIDSEQRTEERASDIKICPNCSGEVPVQEHTSAAQCPYCDSYIIFNERVEGQYAPDYIIPFRHGKEAVKKLMRDKFSKCTFAPTDFLSEVRLNSMVGEYIPFWLYDYDTHYVYHGEGRRVRSWTTGDTHYTETSFYDIYREMDINFDRIPADASLKMPDNIMDLLEPYDYSGLTEWKPEYMSGFQGEKYNMTADLIESRARAKMEQSAGRLAKETVSGYSSVTDTVRNLTVQDKRENYGLLPVWVYHYQYKGQEYPFYINGQTAKIVGKTPISGKKVLLYSATLWACLTAILQLFVGLWNLL